MWSWRLIKNILWWSPPEDKRCLTWPQQQESRWQRGWWRCRRVRRWSSWGTAWRRTVRCQRTWRTRPSCHCSRDSSSSCQWGQQTCDWLHPKYRSVNRKFSFTRFNFQILDFRTWRREVWRWSQWQAMSIVMEICDDENQLTEHLSIINISC